MRIFIYIIFTSLTILSFSSCKPNYEKIFAENEEYFENNKAALISLIYDIENTELKNWDKKENLSIPVENLSDRNRQTLSLLGINRLELSINPNRKCDKNYCITLNVTEGWNIETLGTVQLVYAPCDRQSEKNYHYYDGYHRDIWGQGSNWFIYSDTDYI